MATEVFSTEEITLLDGQSVLLRPNSIKIMKKFMVKFNEMGNLPDNDEEASLNLLTDLAEICLAKQLPDLVKDREVLEDTLDQLSIYKIIEVCAGIKLNNPDLVQAAIMMNNAAEAGKI